MFSNLKGVSVGVEKGKIFGEIQRDHWECQYNLLLYCYLFSFNIDSHFFQCLLLRPRFFFFNFRGWWLMVMVLCLLCRVPTSDGMDLHSEIRIPCYIGCGTLNVGWSVHYVSPVFMSMFVSLYKYTRDFW